MKNIYTCVKICIMYCIRLMIKDSDNSSSNHHKSTSAIIVLIIMISDKIDVNICIYIYTNIIWCVCVLHISPQTTGGTARRNICPRKFDEPFRKAGMKPSFYRPWRWYGDIWKSQPKKRDIYPPMKVTTISHQTGKTENDWLKSIFGICLFLRGSIANPFYFFLSINFAGKS